MPHATPRRSRASAQNAHIKQDPDPQDSPTLLPLRNHGSTSSQDGLSSLTHIPVDRTFYRAERSDAPTPSERLVDPEPLLREVRQRPAMQPPAPDESFSFHVSFQDIGKKLKACNDTLGELQQLGLSHAVSLPELVLVGDQSAGKSSLMSGLAGIDLPRSDGTCTRCPLHIRVSRNNEWSCRVSIRKDHVYQPPAEPIRGFDVNDRAPFFPWKKLPATTTFEFKSVQDKTQIEDVLRWAQLAILNDDKNVELFIPGSGSIAVNTPADAVETTAKFSPNVVALEIKGPDLPDLSFYDLPGIFHNPKEASDDYLCEVVQNLAKSYIVHPSAIILCAMPMNTDPENSSTFGLTRRLGATARTIGVLTKADLLSTGSLDHWLAVMKGDGHRTGLGHFITSRPQHMNLEQLKNWEETMFSSGTAEWPEAFRAFEDRCGVERLMEFLSHRLTDEFTRSLPMIKRKVVDHLDNVNRQLSRLPELPSNVELEIQTALINFADSARSTVEDFAASFGPLPAAFRDCLLQMKPKFIMRDRSDPRPVVEISDGESVSDATNTPSRRRRMQSQHVQTPSKRVRMATPSTRGDVSFNDTPIKRENGSTNTSLPIGSDRPSPFEAFSKINRGFRSLRQVKEEIESKMRAGMPDRIPEKVYEDLAMEAIKPWNEPVGVFLRETMGLLHERLKLALDKAFESLKKRSVYTEVQKHLTAYLHKQGNASDRALQQLYHDEAERLLTFNNEAFTSYQKDANIELKRFRHHQRMSTPNEYVDWGSLSQQQQADDVKQRDRSLGQIGADPFEREVEVMGYVRAYYRLAALRFADAAAQCILCRMIPEIRRALPYYLEQELGIRSAGAGGPEAVRIYERLMEEDQVTAARRESLKEERKKFETAMASIENLQAGGGDGILPAETNGYATRDTRAMMRGAINEDTAMQEV